MLSIRTIPAQARRVMFVAAASLDLVLRVVAAQSTAKYLLFADSAQDAVKMVTVGELSAVVVPIVAAPLILSPIAYLLGQIFVVLEAKYVRYVSAVFILASFVVYTINPWMSVLAAVLAYMILGSGMIPQRD
jgi:hypothetical protein